MKTEKIKESPNEINEFTRRLLEQSDYAINPSDSLLNTPVARDVETAFLYDYESILKKIDIKRIAETDYIRIEFESEDPKLSYFALNAFLEEFIKYFYDEQYVVEKNSVEFYTELAHQKKRYLDSLVNKLNAYKTNMALVNLEDQGKAIVSQLRELELTRETENKKIPSYQSAISNLNQYIFKYNGDINNKNFAENVFLREDVKQISDQINTLNDQYIALGMKDDGMKKRIESLRDKRNEITKKYAQLPRKVDDRLTESTQKLLEDRIQKENELRIAKESVSSLDREINRLTNQKSSLVSSNAYVGNIEQEVILAQNEYTEAFEKLNKAKLSYIDKEKPLRVLEAPLLPEKAEPSQSLLLSLFAGIASLTLTAVIIFLLAYFDSTLNSPFQFRKFTKLNLLGSVNEVPQKKMDLSYIFSLNGEDKPMEFFKESLRKIRYEIESSGGKTFLFTSPKEQEGKSFLIVALAYSLGLKNKKVLIIDTNFKNNTLTYLSNSQSINQPNSGFIQVSGHAATPLNLKVQLPNVDIIGNKSAKNSPSEVFSGIDFKKTLDSFAQKYDFIFLEAASLNKYADTRELIPYVDKVIPVFDAHSTMGPTDSESVNFLQSLNGKLMGAILNRVDLKNLN